MTDLSARAPGADRLHDALRAILDEYDEQTRWLGELEVEARTARRRREGLNASLNKLLRALPRAEAEPFARRYGEIERRRSPASKRLPRDGPVRAIMELLCDWHDPEIRVHEVTTALERLGFEPGPRYAANTLIEFAKRGYVARAGRGRYRINRVNIDMITVGNDMLAREVGRA